jgi:hypothetical protein
MKRAVMVLVIALCAMALPALAAQQAAGPAPTAGVSSAPVNSPSSALPGPRLQPEWRSFEPSVTDTSASGRASLMSDGRSHTIVISTLALILIVVIVVLLVAK